MSETDATRRNEAWERLRSALVTTHGLSPEAADRIVAVTAETYVVSEAERIVAEAR